MEATEAAAPSFNTRSVTENPLPAAAKPGGSLTAIVTRSGFATKTQAETDRIAPLLVRPKPPAPHPSRPRTRYQKLVPTAGVSGSVVAAAAIPVARQVSPPPLPTGSWPRTPRTTSCTVPEPAAGAAEFQVKVTASDPMVTPETSPGTAKEAALSGAQSHGSPALSPSRSFWVGL